MIPSYEQPPQPNNYDSSQNYANNMGFQSAIRDDLNRSRGFAGLVATIYSAPYDSIHENTNCDIADNGLIEIDISDFNHWKIYHYEVGNWSKIMQKYSEFPFCGQPPDKSELSWSVLSEDKTLIAEMSKKGFKWLISQEERENLGEGLC